MSRLMLRHITTLVLTGISLTGSQAAEMEVPMEVQFHLFLKIATFDRNLTTRVGDEIVVAVLYQSRYRTSLNAKDEFLRVMGESSVKFVDGIPVTSVSLDVQESSDLEQMLLDHAVDAVYITPLRAVELGRVTDITRKLQIMSLTGVPLYVEQGTSAGVEIRGERPEIIINLSAARAEGVDFSSQLLNLARVIAGDTRGVER